MKLKLAFCSMPKMRQGRNGMAKAVKLLMLLLASSLVCAPAHSECYTRVGLAGYVFTAFNDEHGLPVCNPGSVRARASDHPWYAIDNADKLREAYEDMRRECRSTVAFVWKCPVWRKLKNVNQIHSTWNREIAACLQHVNNQYKKYNGRMCYEE